MKEARAFDPRSASLVWALAGFLLVLGWQFLTVHANYGGNWTGLFFTGATVPVPDALASTTYHVQSAKGYDGQYYRLIAHDPFFRENTAAYLDAPRVRARRILIPLLAWVLAGGRQGLIDGAYVLVVAAFILGGIYWLACTMVQQGRHAAWGFLFLMVPATVVSIDRMTIDVAVGALTALFAFQFLAHRERWLWFTLAAVALARETGLMLAGAAVLAALLRRDFRRAVLWASAALPALAWYLYVQYNVALAPVGARMAAIPRWVVPHLGLGIVQRALDPPKYGLAASLEMFARGIDALALAATVAAAVMCVVRLRKTPTAALRAVLCFQVFFMFFMTNKLFWNTPFGYSRPIAPLFVLLIAGAGMGPNFGAVLRGALLSGLVDLRLFTEIKAEVLGVLHWL
jgi:hypothetical protein